MNLIKVTFIVFALLLSSVAQASLEDSIQQARDAYSNQDYAEAQTQFEALLQSYPNHSYLWYHLGDAFIKQDQKAKALWAYLNAKKGLPRNLDLRSNVESLELELQYKPFGLSHVVGKAYFWTDFFTSFELFLLLSLLFVVLWGLVWVQSRKRVLGSVGFFLTGLFLVYLTGLLFLSQFNSMGMQQALALQKGDAKTTYLDASDSLFSVEPGEALQIIDQQKLGDELWLRVQNKNGQKGWLLQGSIGRV